MQIAIAQEADEYATNRRAATAAAKAKRLWPNAIGEVLAGEVMGLMDLPSWLQPHTRTQRLIDAILSIPEGGCGASGPPGAPDPGCAAPNSGAGRAA
jgi:hypothetical protein